MEPSQTVTVETTEVVTEDDIIAGSENIIHSQAISHDSEDGHLLLQNVKSEGMCIPSFHYRDNSVHLYECSPFLEGIFVTFNKENYHIYCLV